MRETTRDSPAGIPRHDGDVAARTSAHPRETARMTRSALVDESGGSAELESQALRRPLPSRKHAILLRVPPSLDRFGVTKPLDTIAPICLGATRSQLGVGRVASGMVSAASHAWRR
jgi:hypothetical protein